MTKLSIGAAAVAISLIAMTLNAAAGCGDEGGGNGGGYGGGGYGGGDGAHRHRNSNPGSGGWVRLPSATPEELEQANRPQPPPQPQFSEQPPDELPPQPDGFRFPTPAEASPMIDERNGYQDDVEFLQQMRQQVYGGNFVLVQDAEGELYPVSVEGYAAGRAINALFDRNQTDDADELSRQIASEIKTMQDTARDSIDSMIKFDQQQVADINNKLGYNRYRPLR